MWTVRPPREDALDELLERFLVHVETGRNFSEHSLRAYSTDLASFVAFCEERGRVDPRALTRVGAEVTAARVRHILDPGEREPSPRLVGLAALGLALCRSPDGLAALAAMLPDDEGGEVVRLSRLAGALAEPGEPSRMRGLIRRTLQGEGRDG